jgi:hypothetical protein
MKTNDDSFFTPAIDPRREARALLMDAMGQIFIWMTDAPSLVDRGLRASVVIYCVRPDLLDGKTLERIGDESDRTRQHIHNLAENFCLTIGLKS